MSQVGLNRTRILSSNTHPTPPSAAPAQATENAFQVSHNVAALFYGNQAPVQDQAPCAFLAPQQLVSNPHRASYGKNKKDPCYLFLEEKIKTINNSPTSKNSSTLPSIIHEIQHSWHRNNLIHETKIRLVYKMQDLKIVGLSDQVSCLNFITAIFQFAQHQCSFRCWGAPTTQNTPSIKHILGKIGYVTKQKITLETGVKAHYTGFMQAGKPNGMGTLHNSYGNRSEGQFQAGKLIPAPNALPGLTNVLKEKIFSYLNHTEQLRALVLDKTTPKAINEAMRLQKTLTIPNGQNIQRYLQSYVGTQDGKQSRLEVLNFEDETVTDEDLKFITKNFPHLKTLNISECSLISDDGLEHLKLLVNLTELNLGLCSEITDAGVAHLKGLVNLTKLNLGWCTKITNAGVNYLKDLVNLTSLNLGGCTKITDAGFEHLTSLVTLRELILGWCNITNAGLEHLKDLINLRELNLHCCHQVSDSGLRHLRGLVNLNSLDLASTNLTETGLEHLTGLVKLTFLNLSQTKFGGALFEPWNAFVNLKGLMLKGCTELTDSGLSNLKELKQLFFLHLGECRQITNAGLVHLMSLKELFYLELSHTSISDEGLAPLKALEHLASLSLNGCMHITDAGNTHLRALTKLISLDIQQCDKMTKAEVERLKRDMPMTAISFDEIA